MRIAIVGSRDYPDLERVTRFVGSLPYGTVVISGTEPRPRKPPESNRLTVDETAILAARRRGLVTKVHPALWQTHGTSAGPIRNREIVKDADCLVAFWDFYSRGTRHALLCAVQAQIPFRACDTKGNEIPRARILGALGLNIDTPFVFQADPRCTESDTPNSDRELASSDT